MRILGVHPSFDFGAFPILMGKIRAFWANGALAMGSKVTCKADVLSLPGLGG